MIEEWGWSQKVTVFTTYLIDNMLVRINICMYVGIYVYKLLQIGKEYNRDEIILNLWKRCNQTCILLSAYAPCSIRKSILFKHILSFDTKDLQFSTGQLIFLFGLLIKTLHSTVVILSLYPFLSLFVCSFITFEGVLILHRLNLFEIISLSFSFLLFYFFSQLIVTD